MTRRLAVLGFASLLLVAAGCPAEKSTPSGSAPVAPVVISDAASVTADGTQFVTITVSSGRAPISLTTTRGAFSNGLKAYTMATVPGTVTLTPCNARTQATCAGPAVVAATTAEYTSASITVTFEGYENCSNAVDDNGDDLVDCADPQCPLDMACSTTGLVCSSTQQCNKCVVTGGVAEASGEQTCTDSLDNDCDGRADCADDQCDGRTCTLATSALGVCSGGACVCDQTEAAESTCGDGKDNDCDGVADCADPDCLGKTCNAAGMQCTGLVPSTCAYCPRSQVPETGAMCGDGKDNDCDGKVDCYDTGCQPTTVGGSDGAQCSPFGGHCTLTMGVPSCGCSTGASTETSCSGGVDDDCDGKVDCADEDCQPAASGLVGPSCGANGRACTAGGTCACPGGDTEICDNYDVAGNPVDDNCDGRANCMDYSCRPTVPGEYGADCSPVGTVGESCDATGVCACTGNGGTAEVAEVSCTDGFDNDCDFLVDCDDPDCDNRACGPSGAICDAATSSCFCPTGTVETSCTDGVDNNCNGKVDCEEPSCASLACNTLPTPYTCISGVCTNPSTRYGIKVTPARPRIPADGVNTTLVTIEVTYDGQPAPGLPLTLSLGAPVIGTLSSTSVTTDSLGKAATTFRSSGPTGVQTITATVTGVGATGSGTVTLPAIGEIRILAKGGVLYPVMGVKTSGFQEQNQVTVEILDTQLNTYPDGLAVLFEHQMLGGSTLSDPVAAPTCSVPNCVQSWGATDANGLSRTRLYSGTVAGVLGMTAQATAGGVTRLFQLPSIAVVGAKPNAGHFSVMCDPVNVPAYADTSCHISNIDAPITCVAFMKDRFNNVLGRATTVSFMSEAGAVGPPAVSPAYDPAKAADAQADLGTAVDFINTLGAKLPKDVTAQPGEGFISTAPDACGVIQRSPRDGVATVVAWTPGEEAFFDANGNGTYDFPEPFIDLPEPFVDYDDDDVRDGDEPFIDTDGDGLFDVANGVWDSSANIWTKTLIVYTGLPAFMQEDIAGVPHNYESRWLEVADLATYPGPTPLATFDIDPAFGADLYTDCNGNNQRDINVYETFTDDNANGAYDLGETFKDCNGNNLFDTTITDEAFVDVNGNGTYDRYGTPETSETLIVAASDRNLNLLTSSTTYDVTQPSNTAFSISYNGLKQLPDMLGFRFGYQPCNVATVPSCALDCADVAEAANGRCVMKTTVADYGYGYTASVTFRGNDMGTQDIGTVETFWEVQTLGWTQELTVYGTHQ